MRAADFFAGAGGTSTGAEMAGAQVVAAVNHWPRAVATHTANHPGVMHRCQDIALMDPRDLPAFDIGLFSPECRGHTPARGRDRAPRHDPSRATAWCVINVSEVCRPRFLAVENVPGMRSWTLYPMWKAALEALGYQLEEHVVNAADCGVPQERERLIVLGALGASPPRWDRPAMRRISAGETIEWSSGEWSAVTAPGRASATLRRIEEGRRRFGPRFLVRYNGAAKHGRPISAPWGTLTTIDRFGIVDGDRMRMPTLREYLRAFSFPESYQLTGTRRDGVKLCGNAVPPLLAASYVGAILAAA